MSLYGAFQGTGETGFGWSSTADEVVDGLDLSGQHILITGCNSGLGSEATRTLAGHGATVLGAARSQNKAARIAAEVDGDVVPVVCELSEPSSIKACVDQVREYGQPLDAIICNAGIMALPDLECTHGYEKQFFVNHVGHFMLVTDLVDQLTNRGRVIMLSSNAHRSAPPEGIQFFNLSGQKTYSGWEAYSQSKLANILFAKELCRRFEADGGKRIANAVHPGVISTNLTRYMNPVLRFMWKILSPLVLKSPAQGAATETWAAVHPDAATTNGQYLKDCNVSEPSETAKRSDLAEQLWQETEEIIDEVTADV